MFDQVLENLRKASETSLQMQQEMFRHWSQQWLTSAPDFGAAPGDWPGSAQKRWFELAIDALNKQREAFDGMYRSSIQVLEQTLRLTDAKSPDDYRRTIEEVLRKSYDSFREQSETQYREFQRLAMRAFDMAQKP